MIKFNKGKKEMMNKKDISNSFKFFLILNVLITMKGLFLSRGVGIQSSFAMDTSQSEEGANPGEGVSVAENAPPSDAPLVGRFDSMGTRGRIENVRQLLDSMPVTEVNKKVTAELESIKSEIPPVETDLPPAQAGRADEWITKAYLLSAYKSNTLEKLDDLYRNAFKARYGDNKFVEQLKDLMHYEMQLSSYQHVLGGYPQADSGELLAAVKGLRRDVTQFIKDAGELDSPEAVQAFKNSSKYKAIALEGNRIFNQAKELPVVSEKSGQEGVSHVQEETVSDAALEDFEKTWRNQVLDKDFPKKGLRTAGDEQKLLTAIQALGESLGSPHQEQFQSAIEQIESLTGVPHRQAMEMLQNNLLSLGGLKKQPEKKELWKKRFLNMMEHVSALGAIEGSKDNVLRALGDFQEASDVIRKGVRVSKRELNQEELRSQVEASTQRQFLSYLNKDPAIDQGQALIKAFENLRLNSKAGKGKTQSYIAVENALQGLEDSPIKEELLNKCRTLHQLGEDSSAEGQSIRRGLDAIFRYMSKLARDKDISPQQKNIMAQVMYSSFLKEAPESLDQDDAVHRTLMSEKFGKKDLGSSSVPELIQKRITTLENIYQKAKKTVIIAMIKDASQQRLHDIVFKSNQDHVQLLSENYLEKIKKSYLALASSAVQSDQDEARHVRQLLEKTVKINSQDSISPAELKKMEKWAQRAESFAQAATAAHLALDQAKASLVPVGQQYERRVQKAEGHIAATEEKLGEVQAELQALEAQKQQLNMQTPPPEQGEVDDETHHAALAQYYAEQSQRSRTIKETEDKIQVLQARAEELANEKSRHEAKLEQHRAAYSLHITHQEEVETQHSQRQALREQAEGVLQPILSDYEAKKNLKNSEDLAAKESSIFGKAKRYAKSLLRRFSRTSEGSQAGEEDTQSRSSLSSRLRDRIATGLERAAQRIKNRDGSSSVQSTDETQHSRRESSHTRHTASSGNSEEYREDYSGDEESHAEDDSL